MPQLIHLTPPQFSSEHIKEKITCIRAHRERIFRVSHVRYQVKKRMPNQIIFIGYLIALICYTSTPQFTQCLEQKLLLHFDVNQTIIAIDSAQDKNIEDSINMILASFTYEQWEGSPNKQSYARYIADKIMQENPLLHPNDPAFMHIKNEFIKNYPHYLEKYPSILGIYAQEKTLMLKNLSMYEMGIFPSFFKVISWLNTHFPNNYTIYLRTFGKDLREIVPALEKQSTLRFAAQTECLKDALLSMRKNTQLFELCTNIPHKHFAIRDDYFYWKAHEFKIQGGKPFPIDLTNPYIISMFFDDNAGNRFRSIICPIGINGEIIDPQELIKKGNIVVVNSKQAILDEDYFINKIKAMLP